MTNEHRNKNSPLPARHRAVLFALFINDKLIDDYKTLAQAIFAASEEELLEIDWTFTDGCLRAESPSNYGTTYRIKKNTLESIYEALELPSNVKCATCEWYRHTPDDDMEPEFTECVLCKLEECPIVKDKIS